MPATILRSVLLPLPFAPMIPKNSPGATWKVTSSSACCSSYEARRNGCWKYSFSVVRRSCGSWNVFDTCKTSIAASVAPTPSAALSEPGLMSLEERCPERQDEERDRDGNDTAELT